MAAAQRPRHLSIPPLPAFTSHIATSQNVQSPDGYRDLKSPVVASAAHRLPSSEQDYSRLHPDELFTRLSVAEVRNINNKLRNEADSKQEELRTMVGERYRDLLQASTSIITIASDSQRVTEALSEVEEASKADDSRSVQSIPRKSGVDESDLAVLQSLSAHLKLLLDAPEQLWRLLECHNYLHAAWLFLISRVVYRSLTRDELQGEDDVEISWSKSAIDVSEQFPLAQRQWDTISQFRPQISHKATQSLRLTNRTPRETCDTLVAILLLDSIPVSETVSLFLTQRSKALRTLLARLSPAASKSPARLRPPSPMSADRRQNREAASALLKPRSPSPSPRGRESTAVSLRLARRTRKEAVQSARDTLKQALDLLVGTVETIRAIYGGDHQSESSELPLVEQILESVQSSSATLTNPRKRSRHASRLSIISSFHATPAPIPSRNSSQPLTSTTILDSLPSSQLLLQFLPASIVSYSPYIDTVSARAQLSKAAISSTSAAWFDASLASLRSNITAWFAQLDSIRSVWEARSLLSEYQSRLTISEMARLTEAVNEACAERARSVWATSLAKIQRTAEDSVAFAVRSIEEGNDMALASSPVTFPSSPVPLPSFTHSTPKNNSFVSFQSALQHRITARDPLLDRTLISLEQAAHRIKKDLDFMQSDDSTQVLTSSLTNEYTPQAEKAAINIANHIKGRLSEANSEEVSIFLGRLSVKLVGSSRFIIDLIRSQESRDAREHFLAIFQESLSRWRRNVLDSVVTEYRDLLAPDAAENDLSKLRASPALAQCVLRMVDAVNRIGLSSMDLEAYQVAEHLLRAFLQRLLSLEWNGQRPLQASWDLAFTQHLVASFEPPHHTNGKSSQHDFQETIDLQLARWQVLLGPLIGSTTQPSTSPKSPTGKNTNSILLPFGAPSAQEDFTPAVQFVKPGPRFAMLLVGKSSGRK